MASIQKVAMLFSAGLHSTLGCSSTDCEKVMFNC